jgi:uncharacterized membrane protein
MPIIEDSVEIEAAATDVFRYCHDIAARPLWDDRVLRIKMLSTAPIRSGTLIRVDAARSGTYAFSWDAEYSQFRYPSGSTLRVIDAAPSSPFVRGSTETWTFTSSGGRTRMHVKWSYVTKGFVAKLLDRLAGRSAMKRAIRRSLANLKRNMENR